MAVYPADVVGATILLNAEDASVVYKGSSSSLGWYPQSSSNSVRDDCFWAVQFVS